MFTLCLTTTVFDRQTERAIQNLSPCRPAVAGPRSRCPAGRLCALLITLLLALFAGRQPLARARRPAGRHAGCNSLSPPALCLRAALRCVAVQSICISSCGGSTRWSPRSISACCVPLSGPGLAVPGCMAADARLIQHWQVPANYIPYLWCDCFLVSRCPCSAALPAVTRFLLAWTNDFHFIFTFAC